MSCRDEKAKRGSEICIFSSESCSAHLSFPTTQSLPRKATSLHRGSIRNSPCPLVRSLQSGRSRARLRNDSTRRSSQRCNTSTDALHRRSEFNIYGYVPSLGGGAAFVAIFGLLTIANIALGVRSHFKAVSIVIAVGGLAETIGWVGRIWSHLNIASLNAFLIQQIWLVRPHLIIWRSGNERRESLDIVVERRRK